MTDAEYIYRQDIREKKSAGRGIYHKRSGSKTRYVGLPSDHLTEAELKRRNGEVKTYNIGRKLTYEEFKALPIDLATEYVYRLQLVYKASITDIALSLGAKRTAFDNYAKAHGVYKPGSNYRGTTKTSPLWPEFLDGKRDTKGNLLVPVEEPQPEPEITEAPAPKPEITKAPATRKIMPTHLRFDAGGTPEQLLDLIMSMLADTTKADRFYDLTFQLLEMGPANEGEKGGED